MTTYDVYFGPAGNMTLRSEGQVGAAWNIPAGELVYGQEYEWKIDTVSEYGTTYGQVWSFTAVIFAPPVDRIVIKRLVGAAANSIWYEDI
jgi:hypothetical protein